MNPNQIKEEKDVKPVLVDDVINIVVEVNDVPINFRIHRTQKLGVAIRKYCSARKLERRNYCFMSEYGDNLNDDDLNVNQAELEDGSIISGCLIGYSG